MNTRRWICEYCDASCRFESRTVVLRSVCTTHEGAGLIAKAYSQVWGFTTWIREV